MAPQRTNRGGGGDVPWSTLPEEYQGLRECGMIFPAKVVLDGLSKQGILHLNRTGMFSQKVALALARLAGPNLQFHVEAAKAGWSDTLD